MAHEKFAWCRSCNEVHHVTPYDKAPLYDRELLEGPELAVDDWRAFVHRHAGHPLEALAASDQASWHGASVDPMQQKYIEVTNGRVWFVMRAFRTSIHEPLRFEAIPGRLRVKRVVLEVQADAIRKELKKYFSWGVTPPSDAKLELFIGLFQQLVCDLVPDGMNAAALSHSEAAVGRGDLSDGIAEKLLQKCVPYFSPEELNELKRFVTTRSDADGVMTLRAQYEYGIESSPEVSLHRGDSK
jgi:hypothetical protein